MNLSLDTDQSVVFLYLSVFGQKETISNQDGKLGFIFKTNFDGRKLKGAIRSNNTETWTVSMPQGKSELNPNTY